MTPDENCDCCFCQSPEGREWRASFDLPEHCPFCAEGEEE